LNVKTPVVPLNFQADGLSITAAEPWFKVKVQLVQRYLQAFIMNAAAKADEIIFVDAFSGSGLYSTGHQKAIFPSVALATLTGDLPIHRWIFCERDPEQAYALQVRVKKYGLEKNVSVFTDALPELTDRFRTSLPTPKRGHKVAVLCLVDPFSLDMPLGLMEKWSGLGFSFLVPFTFVLNDRLTYRHYTEDHPDILRKYVGGTGFDSLSKVSSNIQFYKHLVRLYQNNMLVMGMNTALSVHKLESHLINLPVFYMGFFSRQFSAQAIQRDVNVSEHLQFDLFG
jgi:three-Cys-motif partner protein